MNRTLEHLPSGTTVSSASIAGLAAVGIVFLIPSPAWHDLAPVTVPGVALMLLLAMQLFLQHSTDRWTEHGRALAQLDVRTELPSLPVAELFLSTEFAAAERGRELVVVVCRFEGFEHFATTRGREAADRLLLLSGRILKRRTRGMNLSARLDDQGTFLSILSGQSVAGARIFAERVQKDLMALEVAEDPQPVSVGIAAFDPQIDSPGRLLLAAEKALRSAEQLGSAIVISGEVGQAVYSK